MNPPVPAAPRRNRISNFIRAVVSRSLSTAVRLLTFLKVVDEHDGGVSLTNVAFMACIAKITFSANCSITDLGALIGVLLSYSHKRMTRAKVQDATEAVTKALVMASDAKAQLGDLGMAVKGLTDRLAVVDNRTKPLGGR